MQRRGRVRGDATRGRRRIPRRRGGVGPPFAARPRPVVDFTRNRGADDPRGANRIPGTGLAGLVTPPVSGDFLLRRLLRRPSVWRGRVPRPAHPNRVVARGPRSVPGFGRVDTKWGRI